MTKNQLWAIIQRRVGEVPDGEPGIRTAEAVAKALGIIEAAAVPPRRGKSTSAAIYAEATRYLGIAEKAGKASHPLIEQAIRLSADWLDRDDSATAWCGCIRGLIGIRTGTGTPPESYRAISWQHWGTLEVSRATPEAWEQGDTVVVNRPGGKHVAVFHGIDRKRILLMGGNQSDAFNIKAFSLRDVVSVRRSFES